MEVRGDLSTASLYLSIPQAFLEYSDDNWDPPTRWDNGIAGVLMDYYLSAQSQHEENAGDSQILTGNGTVGTNLGAWRLRADWQTNQRSGQGTMLATGIGAVFMLTGRCPPSVQN